MLDEATLVDQSLEFLVRDVVVVDAVLFAGSRLAGRVGDGEHELLRVRGEEAF